MDTEYEITELYNVDTDVAIALTCDALFEQYDEAAPAPTLASANDACCENLYPMVA